MIYNKDCFKVLPTIKTGSVDLVLTDPPYLISRKTRFQHGGGWNDPTSTDKRTKKISMDFGEWDKENIDFAKLLKMFHRILREGGTLLVFFDVHKINYLMELAESVGFKQPRLCLWQKTNPVPVNSKLNYLTNSREYFFTMVKGSKPTFNSEYDNGLYELPICGGKERTSHPTQKPLLLIKQLVEKHSNEGDLILDPFLGSGTTAVACQELNRKYIGIEKDETYFNIAKERLSGGSS